nr:PREDICTED: octapeptide-repeat protein T2-like [Megachile rotundata]
MNIHRALPVRVLDPAHPAIYLSDGNERRTGEEEEEETETETKVGRRGHAAEDAGETVLGEAGGGKRVLRGGSREQDEENGGGKCEKQRGERGDDEKEKGRAPLGVSMRDKEANGGRVKRAREKNAQKGRESNGGEKESGSCQDGATKSSSGRR